jgi:hypothetical protein
MLAPRCDELLACDAVLDAVTSARARTAGLPGVRNEQQAVSRPVAAGLVRPRRLVRAALLLRPRRLGLGLGSLRPGGQILAVHWRHCEPGHPAVVARRRRRCGFGDDLAGLDAEAGAAPPEGTAAARDVCRPTSG